MSEVFNANKEFYKSIHLWTAVMKKESEWHNYFMKVMPMHGEKEEPQRLLETERFLVLHECFDLSGFPSIIESLRSGKLKLCDVEVHVNFPENVNLDPEMYYRYSRWMWGLYHERFPFFGEEIRPSSSVNLPRDLKVELMSLDIPYSDERDVLREFMGVKSGSINSGAVSVVLPVYLAIRECFFEENTLRYGVEFHKGMKKHIDFGIIIRDSKGVSKRYSKGIRKKNLKISGDFCFYDDYEPVEANVVSAQLALRYKKTPFISDIVEEILRPTLPLKAFENFWSEDRFARCLRGELGDKRFEWSVVTLLTLCGLKVIWTGWTKGQVALGGTDFLAYHKDTWIVGECTIGAVKGEKIDRLLESTSRIRKSLGLVELSTKGNIAPVIFTCSKVSEGTRKSATDSGVKVKGLDDIMRILDDMKRNKPPQEIVNFIREREW